MSTSHSRPGDKLKSAKMKLRINGEDYIAYGLLEEQSGYTVFEVKLLVKDGTAGKNGSSR